MRRILSVFVYALMVIAIAGFGGILLVEWMAGCGETYIDSKGGVHENGCIVIRK